MEQLTDALRDLDPPSPPSPPSPVDIDAVVRRAHRHEARVRTFVVATIAAMLAIAAAVPLARAHHPGTVTPPAACEPAGSPARQPAGSPPRQLTGSMPWQPAGSPAGAPPGTEAPSSRIVPTADTSTCP